MLQVKKIGISTKNKDLVLYFLKIFKHLKTEKT